MSSRETIVINTRADREKVAHWAHGVSEGTIVEFRKKTRSHEQSAKMHAMLGEVADQVVWYGSKLKVEDWKNIFTASLRKAQVVPGIDPGTVVPLGIHTSTMTVDEMSNMIEAIYAFGAQPEHPVVFKDPQASDQSNSGEASPSASAGEDAGDSLPASEGGESPQTSSPPSSSSPVEWLTTCARMLWAATHSTGNADDNLDLLNNQRKAVPVPDNATQDERDRAGSMYRRCKQVVLHEIDPTDALKMVSGYAGCDVREIGG